MACNKQFENLFTILDNSKYDIDTPLKKVLQEAVEKAGFCEEVKKSVGKKEVKTTKQTTKKSAKKTEKKRKVSSYNLFVGHQMKIEGQTMGEAVPLWKQLGEKEKQIWKDKADILNQENSKEVDSCDDSHEAEKKKSKAKGKGNGDRKTSGYNLFIGDQMKNKGKKMGEAVGLWKELSEKEKLVWKEKATAWNQAKENPKKKSTASESESDCE